MAALSPALAPADSLLASSSPDIVIPASPWSATRSPSPNKRRKGKGRADDRRDSVLSERDGNEGLLVDIQSAGGSTPAPNKTLYPPRTPSAFALSLLDKSPSLLKAQLSTPLIPLGTPVTLRKKVELSSARKENETPSTRRSARRAGPISPSPASNAPSPEKHTPASPRTVRYSPSPRRIRSSPRKAAQTPLATSSAPLDSVSPTPPPTSAVTPSTPIHPLGFLSTTLSVSRFPHFSPSTPAIRTHASYRDEELTDCDADGSYWDADEDVSLSYSSGATRSAESTGVVESRPKDEVDEQMAVAVGGLSLHAPTAENDEVDVDDSVELTATEVEDNDEVAPDGDDAESIASGEEAIVSAAGDDQEPTGVADGEAAEAAAATNAPDDGAPEPADAVEVDVPAPASSAEPPVDAAEPHEDYPEKPLECATTVDDDAAQDVSSSLAEASSPADDTPASASSAADAIIENVSPVVEPEAALVEGELASATLDSALFSKPMPAPVVSPSRGSSLPELSSPENEPEDSPLVVDDADFVQQVAEPVDLGESGIVLDSQPTQHNAGELEAGVPAESVPATATPPPAPRPAVSSTTPTRPPASALRQPNQLTSTAAPTAKRQLTKLTSTAAQRSAPGLAGKSKLTALVPCSAAAGSRLLGTSRLAVPKRDGPAGSTGRALGAVVPPAEIRRPSSALSSSTSSTLSSTSSTSSTSAPRLRVVVRPGAPSTAKPAPSSSALKAPASTVRPAVSRPRPTAPAETSARPAPSTARPQTRPLTVPRATSLAQPASRLARSEPPSRSTHPTVPPTSRTTALSATSSAPHVLPSRGAISRPPAAFSASASTMGPPRATVRAPRAALAARKVADVSSTPSLNTSAASPSKRRAGRIVDGKLEVPRVPAAPPTPRPAPLPPAETSSFTPRSATPTRVDAGPSTSAPISTASPSPSRLSPRRQAAQSAPVSPHRSPRRILSNQCAPSAEALPPTASSTALIAPAEKLVTSLSTAIFEPAARPAPVRATRRTRLAEIQATAQPAVDATDAATEAHAALRSSRRTIAVAVPAAPQPCAEAVAVVQPKTPILRTRRTRLRLLTEEAAAAAELSVEPAPVAEASLPAPVEDAQPSLVRPLPAFRPAPAVTQEELNRLTQRNTKKNQVAFNRIKLETVFLDYARPPSPTSKIRRAFGSEGSLGSSTTKEGREARAAKRRNALRSSADGSELAALAEELKAEPVSLTETEPLKQHFRAAGDDEQYFTPQRTGGALKSAAAGRGRSPGSNPSSASASPRRREPKRVKWDRALVYEGPLDGDSCSSGDGILKSVDLDVWGNSTSVASLGKPTSVTIRMRVFKDEQ